MNDDERMNQIVSEKSSLCTDESETRQILLISKCVAMFVESISFNVFGPGEKIHLPWRIILVDFESDRWSVIHFDATIHNQDDFFTHNKHMPYDIDILDENCIIATSNNGTFLFKWHNESQRYTIEKVEKVFDNQQHIIEICHKSRTVYQRQPSTLNIGLINRFDQGLNCLRI